MVSCPVHIGTSGWHYDHWRGSFYPRDLPARGMLSFYAERFGTVELNNSFYRLPAESTLKSWTEGTPAQFRFAVKASRYLTHMKKLKDPWPGLANFLLRVEALGTKLGPILFQLPPNWHCDLNRLEAFLGTLPGRHHYTVELRDPSWLTPAVYKLLATHNAANCIYDLAGVQSPLEVTADIAYVRLHGPAGPYQGSYSSDTLATWAERIREWQSRLAGIYCYFDNDEAGYAARNALKLRALVER